MWWSILFDLCVTRYTSRLVLIWFHLLFLIWYNLIWYDSFSTTSLITASLSPPSWLFNRLISLYHAMLFLLSLQVLEPTHTQRQGPPSRVRCVIPACILLLHWPHSRNVRCTLRQTGARVMFRLWFTCIAAQRLGLNNVDCFLNSHSSARLVTLWNYCPSYFLLILLTTSHAQFQPFHFVLLQYFLRYLHEKVLRVSLPAALECITVSPMQDLCFAGASNGSIYVIDLSVTAIALSAARAAVGHVKKQGGDVK